MEKEILTTSLILFFILVLSIILVIPTVTSHYVGSHTWYAQPKCTGCHKKIKDEISNGDQIYIATAWPLRDFHRSEVSYTPANPNEACLLCHITGNLTEIYWFNSSNCGRCHAGGTAPPPMHGHNVSSSPQCMGCHYNPSMQNHWSASFPNATGKMYWAVLWLNNSAHKPLTRQEGCLACHTGIRVNLTFSNRFDTLLINYNISNNSVNISEGGTSTFSWVVEGADKK